MMSHEQITAIEKFAADLKRNFPDIEQPRDVEDRLMNVAYNHVRRIIDLMLDHARWEFEETAKEMERVVNNGKN